MNKDCCELKYIPGGGDSIYKKGRDARREV